MDIHIGRDGQNIGIFSENDLPGMFKSGNLQAQDLAWAEGEADWQLITDFASKYNIDLISTKAAMPPPIPNKPSQEPDKGVGGRSERDFDIRPLRESKFASATFSVESPIVGKVFGSRMDRVGIVEGEGSGGQSVSGGFANGYGAISSNFSFEFWIETKVDTRHEFWIKTSTQDFHFIFPYALPLADGQELEVSPCYMKLINSKKSPLGLIFKNKSSGKEFYVSTVESKVCESRDEFVSGLSRIVVKTLYPIQDHFWRDFPNLKKAQDIRHKGLSDDLGRNYKAWRIGSLAAGIITSVIFGYSLVSYIGCFVAGFIAPIFVVYIFDLISGREVVRQVNIKAVEEQDSKAYYGAAAPHINELILALEK